MSPKLRAMMVLVASVTLGGVGFLTFIPSPPSVTRADLADAGISDGQRFVIICPERLTDATKERIRFRQPGSLRNNQRYARIARVAACISPDGGNCFTPATGNVRVTDAQIIVPSRRAVTSVDGGSDGTEDSDVDDALQYVDNCTHLTCAQANVAQDAGTFINPYPTGFCAAFNRLAVQTPPCVIPNGRRAGGAWCEESCGIVDCRRRLPDGGSRWFGFNAMPRNSAVGTQCVPVECSVVAGDTPSEGL